MERSNLKREVTSWINQLSTENKAIILSDRENEIILGDIASESGLDGKDIVNRWQTEITKWEIEQKAKTHGI